MKINYLPQDNDARINNGIGRYDGKPYHIQLLSQTRARLEPIWTKPGAVNLEVNLNDPRFDVSAPPLGWVNTKTNAYYILRRPERVYKQTLRSTQCSGFTHLGQQIDANLIVQALYSEMGEKMFLGEYPSLTEALSWMSGKRHAVAISREICIGRVDAELRVYYKREQVGVLDVPSNTVRIPKAELAWIASKYLEKFSWKVE